MRLAVIFSGGKDSTFSAYKSLKKGDEIKYLITILPKRKDSYMFHVPCLEWTRLQAESMGIKHIFREVSGEKETEVEELKEILFSLKNDIDGVVSGAIASNYQKSRIDRICNELGMKSIAPLWGVDQEAHMRELLKEKFRIIITGVYAEGLGEEWLGKELKSADIDDLVKLKEKYNINLSGEGGEYESFVLDCPIFTKRIAILDAEKAWDKKSRTGHLDIKNAALVQK